MLTIQIIELFSKNVFFQFSHISTACFFFVSLMILFSRSSKRSFFLLKFRLENIETCFTISNDFFVPKLLITITYSFSFHLNKYIAQRILSDGSQEGLFTTILL